MAEMVKMASSSWIARSGQTWKLYVFYALILATIVLIGMFIAAVNGMEIFPGVGQVGLAMLFVVGGFGALLWLANSIRCPQCGERVAWTIIRNSNAGAWLPDLLSMTACPGCGGEG